MLPSFSEPALPSKPEMLFNFSRSVVNAGVTLLKEGSILVPEETIKARVHTCLHCPAGLFRSSDYRCAHESCGCFLNLKIPLKSEHCPLYYWPGDLD
jgi:hypothetical protein